MTSTPITASVRAAVEHCARAGRIEPHQLAAFSALDAGLTPEQRGAFTVGWRSSGSPAAAVPAAAKPAGQVLKVAYESQLDNSGGEGYRECFSSSCGMIARFWLPERIPSDDAYNRMRRGHGDTTDAQAQLSTLRSLGLQADFHTNGTPAKLKAEIDAGRPVAVGWLHHGPASNPSGGGHWTVVIGYDSSSWIMHDPNGEANLAGGGYTGNRNGKALRYSATNWNRRWMPNGEGGWFLTCRKA